MLNNAATQHQPLKPNHDRQHTQNDSNQRSSPVRTRLARMRYQAHNQTHHRERDVEPVQSANARDESNEHPTNRENTPRQTENLQVSPPLRTKTKAQTSFTTNKAYSGIAPRFERSASSNRPPEIARKLVVIPQNAHGIPYRAFDSHTGVSRATRSGPSTNGAASTSRTAKLTISQTNRSETSKSRARPFILSRYTGGKSCFPS